MSASVEDRSASIRAMVEAGAHPAEAEALLDGRLNDDWYVENAYLFRSEPPKPQRNAAEEALRPFAEISGISKLARRRKGLASG